MINVGDDRGKHMIALKEKNIEIVREFFLKNPGASLKDCHEKTGLAMGTIINHIKAIYSEK